MAAQWIRWILRIAVAIAVVVVALAWAVWWIWSRLSPQWDVRTILAVVIVALVLLAAIWWLWWRLPKRQVRGLENQIPDPKERADVEDDFRKTLGQALGGAAVLIGAGFAYLQFSAQQQATRDQLQSTHDLFISNQVSKGFEQLAGKEAAMRLGGIYALEGVMNTSEQYHQPVLEALCAFVRVGTIGMIVNREPATDIQAALTVIGRRADGPGQVDLINANIPRAALNNHADLRGAKLIHATLTRANLSDANLSGADLTVANLVTAILMRADLTNADLNTAGLGLADLRGASLRGAVLSGANLSRAFLNGANLERANLERANLSHADLSEAKDLTQAQLDQACGTDAKLPPGLTLKPCPDNK
jgi:hypothetical protein